YFYQEFFISVSRSCFIKSSPAKRIFFYCVIIQSNGSSELIFRTGHRFRMTMERIRIRIENHATIKNRRYFFSACFHLLIPKLQFSTPFILPVFIQINQHIDASLPITVMRMYCKISMYIKKPSFPGLMHSPAFQEIIILKISYSRKLAEELKEFWRIEFANCFLY